MDSQHKPEYDEDGCPICWTDADFKTFPDRVMRTRRSCDKNLNRYPMRRGRPGQSQSKRIIEAHGLKPTTFQDIFAEITYCKSCVAHYPSPKCMDCEKSMDDMKVPCNWKPNTKRNRFLCDSKLFKFLRHIFRR